MNIFVKPRKGQVDYGNGKVHIFKEDGKHFSTEEDRKETRVFKPKQVG
jgi:hypothetical protein